jgi:multidrug efflux pump subunit AcrA (membrane-fusion protein)
MSEQSSYNAETIEKTKQQIRGLVSEISQLAKTDMEADEFFPAFLERVIQALAAVGGAVWLMGEGRRLTPRYQVNVSDGQFGKSSEDDERHLRLLQHVAHSKQSRLTPPLAISGEGDTAVGNPSRYLLVTSPLTVDGEVEGVVEIFQRPDAQPATQRGYERFLNQMVELAGEWQKSCKLKQFTDRHSLWAQADHFARLAHDSLDLRETCYTIANEARRVIGVDRVSVALRRGRVCKVEAVSGQDTVEPRSNIVVAINELSSKIAAVGEPLWYDGDTEDLPPQIEKSIEKYVDESYAKSVVILPIRRPKTTEDRIDQRHRNEAALESNESNEVIGALVIEQIESDIPKEILEPRIDLVYEHAARAIANSMDHRNVFLLPLFKAIGRLTVVTKARNLPKTLSVAAVLLVLVGILFLVPSTLQISAEGTLEPVEKKAVFVGVSGSVDKVLVHDKEIVVANQPLVQLKNFELAAELTQLRGQVRVVAKSLDAKLLQKTSDSLSPQDIIQLNGEIDQLRQQELTLAAQITVREEQERQLVIRSPIAGQVMLAWDVERSLERRRVEPGQIIMEIADLSKDWELELYMLEGRMRHITEASAAAQKEKRDLKVTYILETDPGEDFNGTVHYIDDVTRIYGDQGPAVLMRVEINKQKLIGGNLGEDGALRPGATVKAKVDCGPCNLAYRWFHEVGSWVQRNVMF